MPKKTKKFNPLFTQHRNKIKILGLTMVLVLYAVVGAAHAEISSPIWLEKKRISLRAMMQKKQPPKKMGEKSHKGTEKKKKKKKRTRSPMSRPAAYFLKSGSFPDLITDSPELVNTVCWLKSPDQSYKKLTPKKTEEGILIFDEALQGGLYKIYLYHESKTNDGTRYHHFATHWFRNAGKDDFEIKPYKEETREGLYGEEPIFYLKELTKDNKDNYVSLKRHTGDVLSFQVLFQGRPVPKVPVTLTTAQDWEKTLVSDEQGKVSFLLIKEVFHTDKVHKKPEPYLAKAVYMIDSDSRQKSSSKEVYTATIPLTVYPTPYDWKSKSAGFFIFTGSSLAVIFAAAIRRKRSLAL